MYHYQMNVMWDRRPAGTTDHGNFNQYYCDPYFDNRWQGAQAPIQSAPPWPCGGAPPYFNGHGEPEFQGYGHAAPGGDLSYLAPVPNYLCGPGIDQNFKYGDQEVYSADNWPLTGCGAGFNSSTGGRDGQAPGGGGGGDDDSVRGSGDASAKRPPPPPLRSLRWRSRSPPSSQRNRRTPSPLFRARSRSPSPSRCRPRSPPRFRRQSPPRFRQRPSPRFRGRSPPRARYGDRRSPPLVRYRPRSRVPGLGLRVRSPKRRVLKSPPRSRSPRRPMGRQGERLGGGAGTGLLGERPGMVPLLPNNVTRDTVQSRYNCYPPNSEDGLRQISMYAIARYRSRSKSPMVSRPFGNKEKRRDTKAPQEKKLEKSCKQTSIGKSEQSCSLNKKDSVATNVKEVSSTHDKHVKEFSSTHDKHAKDEAAILAGLKNGGEDDSSIRSLNFSGKLPVLDESSSSRARSSIAASNVHCETTTISAESTSDVALSTSLENPEVVQEKDNCTIHTTSQEVLKRAAVVDGADFAKKERSMKMCTTSEVLDSNKKLVTSGKDSVNMCTTSKVLDTNINLVTSGKDSVEMCTTSKVLDSNKNLVTSGKDSVRVLEVRVLQDTNNGTACFTKKSSSNRVTGVLPNNSHATGSSDHSKSLPMRHSSSVGCGKSTPPYQPSFDKSFKIPKKQGSTSPASLEHGSVATSSQSQQTTKPPLVHLPNPLRNPVPMKAKPSTKAAITWLQSPLKPMKLTKTSSIGEGEWKIQDEDVIATLEGRNEVNLPKEVQLAKRKRDEARAEFKLIEAKKLEDEELAKRKCSEKEAELRKNDALKKEEELAKKRHEEHKEKQIAAAKKKQEEEAEKERVCKAERFMEEVKIKKKAEAGKKLKEVAEKQKDEEKHMKKNKAAPKKSGTHKGKEKERSKKKEEEVPKRRQEEERKKTSDTQKQEDKKDKKKLEKGEGKRKDRDTQNTYGKKKEISESGNHKTHREKEKLEKVSSKQNETRNETRKRKKEDTSKKSVRGSRKPMRDESPEWTPRQRSATPSRRCRTPRPSTPVSRDTSSRSGRRKSKSQRDESCEWTPSQRPVTSGRQSRTPRTTSASPTGIASRTRSRTRSPSLKRAKSGVFSDRYSTDGSEEEQDSGESFMGWDDESINSWMCTPARDSELTENTIIVSQTQENYISLEQWHAENPPTVLPKSSAALEAIAESYALSSPTQSTCSTPPMPNLYPEVDFVPLPQRVALQTPESSTKCPEVSEIISSSTTQDSIISISLCSTPMAVPVPTSSIVDSGCTPDTGKVIRDVEVIDIADEVVEVHLGSQEPSFRNVWNTLPSYHRHKIEKVADSYQLARNSIDLFIKYYREAEKVQTVQIRLNELKMVKADFVKKFKEHYGTMLQSLRDLTFSDEEIVYLVDNKVERDYGRKGESEQTMVEMALLHSILTGKKDSLEANPEKESISNSRIAASLYLMKPQYYKEVVHESEMQLSTNPSFPVKPVLPVKNFAGISPLINIPVSENSPLPVNLQQMNNEYRIVDSQHEASLKSEVCHIDNSVTDELFCRMLSSGEGALDLSQRSTAPGRTGSCSVEEADTSGRKEEGMELVPVCFNQCLREAKIMCSGCYQTYYCSNQCQESHWEKGHKTECQVAQS